MTSMAPCVGHVVARCEFRCRLSGRRQACTSEVLRESAVAPGEFGTLWAGPDAPRGTLGRVGGLSGSSPCAGLSYASLVTVLQKPHPSATVVQARMTRIAKTVDRDTSAPILNSAGTK